MKRAVRAPLVVAVVMVCVVAGAALAGHATTPTQTSLTESQRRGREIYTTGTTASGAEIAAFLGDDGVEVPATILPCSGCHGDDGRGISPGVRGR